MEHKAEAPLADQPLRPRDLAILFLASGDLRPRKRARDQQADRLGLELKRRVLQRLAELDPEPTDLEAALMNIVLEIGPPLGPTRAVAMQIREEWQMACAAPDWVAQLLEQATHEKGTNPFEDSNPISMRERAKDQ
jgi:hypothetical protein